MKINDKIFNLPPFISTSWNHVVSIHMKDHILIVSLIDGNIIEIPNLQPEILAAIFNAHASFLENEQQSSAAVHSTLGKPPLTASMTLEQPIRFGMTAFDNFGGALQHNPAQANSPDIPKEILQKISAIAKIMAPEEINALPKPELHCNCMHCQIARAITHTMDESKEAATEEVVVSEEELKFQQWDIQQTGDKLFIVTNKLDFNEKYNVYLGQPVGCTCGKPGCEHILAVLQS